MAQTKEGALKQAANRYGISVEELVSYRESEMMRCQICGTWMPSSLFPKNSGPKYTVSGRCLECSRKNYIHKKRTSPPWMKGRKHSDESRKKMSDSHSGKRNHTWKGGVSPKRNRDPLSVMARRFVNHEIESGKIPGPSELQCNDCDGKASEYHHLEGYHKDNWLKIVALCTRCHRERHRKNATYKD